MSSVVLRQLVKSFGSNLAVDHIDLDIGEGELFSLLGSSGCGKTTTLRLINRLIEPTGGRIVVSGREVREWDAIQLRRAIGYVVQAGGLFPHMTVERNIALVCEVEGWPQQRRRRRAHELLELVGLDPKEHAQRYPRELSGGQRQRVGVARSLALDPDTVLLDEPFGALDPMTRSELHHEFLRLKQRVKTTMVIVSHDIDEAFKLGDRIALMRAGRVV
ncbi:MAG: ATP-binding cassette domain-containing protein, partial [Candidatus Eremiobacteraeota bacterium]|nr:ATP-binding cassette domain-containing protein [Candidatus Eremiobacteraeota bacterium]